MNIKQFSSDGKIAYLNNKKNKVADISDNEEEMREYPDSLRYYSGKQRSTVKVGRCLFFFAGTCKTGAGVVQWG